MKYGKLPVRSGGMRSQRADDTLDRRKQFIPDAEKIIEEIKEDFIKWLETRKFAPVIQALKKKLSTIKDDELNFQSKKISDFKQDQAEIISNRIIQKITTQFANHLKGDGTDTDMSLEFIQKVFQLDIDSK